MSKVDAFRRPVRKAKRLKQRRPWRRLFLLSVFLLLAGLLVCLPNLLSTRSGQRWLQRTLASRFPGDMDFQQLSLSWRRGITVEDFQWQDANDESRITVAQLRASPRLLMLLKGELSLGTVVVEQPRIRLSGTRALPQDPPAESEEGENPAPPAPGRWRLGDMQLTVTDGALHIDAGTASTLWQDLNLSVRVPHAGPGQINLRATAAHAAQAGQVTFSAEASRPFTAGTLTGHFQLALDTLDLQTLEPLLTRIGRRETLQGTVSGTVSARMQAGKLVQGSVQLQGRALQVTGPALEPDSLASAAATVAVQLREQDGLLGAQVEFQSDGLDARIDGVCPAARPAIGDVLNSPWQGEVRADLAVLTRQFRHTLALRDGVDVTGGRLEGTVQLADGWILGDLQLVDLQGVYDERPLRLSEDIHASTRFQWSQDRLEVEEFRIRAPFATAEISGSLARLDYQLEVDLEGLQRDVGAFLDLGVRSWKGTATARASVQRNDRQWAWSGAVDLNDLRVTDPGGHQVVEPRVQIQHRVTYDLDDRAYTVEELTLDTAPLTLQDTTLRRAVTQGQATVTGQTRCVYDWIMVRPWLTAFLPEGLRLRGRRDDLFSFAAAYPEGQDDLFLSGLTANAALGFDHAAYQGLEIGPTDVNLSVHEGQLVLAPFVSTVNEGELRFGCRTDLGQHARVITLSEPMPIMRDIHITGPLAAHLLKYVNPIFADLTDISGRLDFESQELIWPVAAGARDELAVIGSVAMRDVRLEGSALLSQILALFNLKPVRGQRLTVRPTAFTVQNGVVRYDDMQIDIGDNPLNFSGTIGLDDSLDMTITLPYTWSGLTARVDRPSGDRIQLPLTGSLSEPRLDTERFLKGQLRQQIEKQIHKGLEELFERL